MCGSHTAVLKMVFENKTIFDKQVVNFVRKRKASLTNQHCTHLWLMRNTSNPLGRHDCSWLILNLTVRLLYLLLYYTCNYLSSQMYFVWTKMRNVWKIVNCCMLFQALYCDRYNPFSIFNTMFQKCKSIYLYLKLQNSHNI